MIGQARPGGPATQRADAWQARRPVSPGSGLMQPPTEPTQAPERLHLRGDEAELYGRHHDDLRRAVTHAVNAPRELIEDACQTAWTIMLQTQPDRTSIFNWLYLVATREAFRLCQREQRHLHLEAMLPKGSRDAVIADVFSIDDILEARDALAILAGLPERQRADLTLLVAGFSYREIAAMTGGRTYTNVNKQIAKGRARVRRARLADSANGDRTGRN